MKVRKEEEEIQKEMSRIRKEMDEERRKKSLEELRWKITVYLTREAFYLFLGCHVCLMTINSTFLYVSFVQKSG